MAANLFAPPDALDVVHALGRAVDRLALVHALGIALAAHGVPGGGLLESPTARDGRQGREEHGGATVHGQLAAHWVFPQPT